MWAYHMNANSHHSQPPALLQYQQNAVEYIERQAAQVSQRTGDCIDASLARANLGRDVYDNVMASLICNAQIAVHFHPERLSRRGESVAEGLLRSGYYKNQFETGLSSGSPSAFAGGERDLWEKSLFDGIYHGVDVQPSGRPKYGALQLISHPDGPAPRFGSCYFLLHPQVCERATFSYGGSQEQDALLHTGTIKTLDPVMAQVFTQLELGHGIFGISELDVASLLHYLTHRFSAPASKMQNLGRALDSFVEAQIHGDIRLDKDVSQLIADPAFRDHYVGDVLNKISIRYGIPLSWHPGFMLSVKQIPNAFRGYSIGSLARRLGGNGHLDAATIGKLANSFELEPEIWKDWASYEDTLTQFRRLWHFLVLHGSPGEKFVRKNRHATNHCYRR